MTWRDHDVCCVGGCGTVLEDRTGRPLVNVVEVVATDDGAHRMLMLYCPECAPTATEGDGAP